MKKQRTAAAASSLKRKALTLALGGALVLAPVAGGASAAAQPTVAVSTSVASGSVQLTASSASALSSPALDTALAQSAQKRINIGPAIDWIKRNAPSIWNGMKSAVSKGWNAFKSWWSNLPSWIRWGIDFVASGGLWDLFDALWHYFF